MAYKIPSGASRDIVLRCWEDEKKTTPADLNNRDISLLIRDYCGQETLTYSTKELLDVSPIKKLADGMLVINLTKADTIKLKGRYSIEVKVSGGDKADIVVVADIYFEPTLIGKNETL